MADSPHKPAFPDQRDISGFLRSRLNAERTQVTWAADALLPYNTVTNWFTEEPSRMSGEALLRLVIAADAVDEFAEWLRGFSRGARLRVAEPGPPPYGGKPPAGSSTRPSAKKKDRGG